jgi:hypothetical protein
MTATQPPALEDLTTTSGHPMFGAETREYLRRVRLADPATLAPWRGGTCPECGEEPAGEGFVRAPGGEAHVILHGSVVLGCEGYWLVSPAAVGLPEGGWTDWRADLPEPAPGDEIELIATADPCTRLRPGDRGTVTRVDALGTVHARWAGGSALGLIPGADSWRTVRPAWCDCGEEPRHTTRVHPTPGDAS